MKFYSILLTITFALVSQSLCDIKDPIAQWTDVVLVRTTKGVVSCTVIKTSIPNPDDLKQFHEGVKLWAISKKNKSWIYAAKIDQEKNISESRSSVISEDEADAIDRIMSRFRHNIDFDKILEQADE